MTLLKTEFFPMIINDADASPISKKMILLTKKIIDRSAYYPTCQKSLKGSFINKLILLWLQNFLPIIRRFRKNHNAQYPLLKMIEIWRKHVDNGDKVGVMLMDLSKVFDTINCNLLMTKWSANCFSRTSLKPMQKYSCKRQKRGYLNGTLSDWTGVMTGSSFFIVALLLFNLFLNDIFMFVSKRNLCNDADDNAL